VDGWLCGDCRSLNTPRAKRCYRCNLPRAFAETDPDLESKTIVRSGQPGMPSEAARPAYAGAPVPAPGTPPSTNTRPRPTLADARSSRGRSRVLLVLLAATTAWSALSTAVLMTRGGTLGLLMALLDRDYGSLGTVAVLGLVSSLLGLLAALAWFVWFDRVLRNVPSLTGQWPDTGRAAAIGWWFVPVVGFIKAPRIVGDAYHRLSVRGTPGLWLIALWALTWIGGTIGPSIAVRVIAFLPFGVTVYLQLADVINLLGQASYVAAGILAMAVVMAIENASQVRRTEGGAALEASPGTAERGAGFEAALRAAAEANAVAKVEQFGVATASSAPYRAPTWTGAASLPGTGGPAAAGRPGGTLLSGSTRPALALGLSPSDATDPGADPRDATEPRAPAGIPVSDDDVPVLRPVLRPPAHAGGAAAIAQPEGAAGSTAIVFRRGEGAPPEGGTPLDPEGEVLADGTRRPDHARARIPRWALALAMAAVGLAIAGGVLLAGRAGEGPRDLGTVFADDLISPRPDPGVLAATPVPAPASRAPATPAPTPKPTRTPTPSPTPVAWIAAREALATSTFDQGWTGRFELQGNLRVEGRKPATWALSVARTGTDAWARSRISDPTAGLSLATEEAMVGRTTWERTGRGPWGSRSRGFGDQPVEALFGVPSADGLTYLDTFREDGEVRFTFRIDQASDVLALGFLRALGLGPLDRTDATVVTGVDGVPIRAALTYAGTTRAGKARLVIEVRYHDVGGSFTIASPKDGGPVIDG
jgi:hypothetical protein